MEIYLIHPMLVHFTIGLLMTGIGFLWASLLIKNKDYCVQVGKTMLYTGTIITVGTVIFGFIAFDSAPHATSAAHDSMLVHRNLALATFSVFILICIYSWKMLKPNETNWLLLAATVIGVILMGATGHFGGNLVFKHQIGVSSLKPSGSKAISSPDNMKNHDHDGHDHHHD